MQIVRDSLAYELDEYRRKMNGEERPIEDVATDAVIANVKIKAARQLLAELETSRVNFARDITPFLPAPPTPLHVKSETYREDDRLDRVANWMEQREYGRSSE
jgi:hypothetical protein